MKKVYTNDMVAHLWAQQSQSEAHNIQRNFYFEGTAIYSYNSHFPIARRVNKDTVLFTTRRYSVTTAKHIKIVRCAIPVRLTIIHCEDVLAEGTSHVRNLTTMKTEFIALLDKALRSRKYTKHYLEQAEEMVCNHTAYRCLFKITKKQALPLSISTNWQVDAKKRVDAQLTEAKRRADIEKEHKARIHVQALAELEE